MRRTRTELGSKGTPESVWRSFAVLRSAGSIWKAIDRIANESGALFQSERTL